MFPPAAHGHPWSDLTGVPTEFVPSAHQHAIGDVSGLQGALDGKAPASSIWTQEQLQDLVAAMFQTGTHSNASITYDDASGSLSITASGGGASLTEEEVEDFVGGLIVQGTGISVAYDDAGNVLSISLAGESYTTAEKNKLAGIATGATANATDAQLRDRSTHTGTQAITTISGLQAALDGKAPTNHSHPIGDVTGLQGALDGKAAMSGWGGLTFDANGVPVLKPVVNKPAPSPLGLLLYARQRAGMLMPEVQRPTGRDFFLQAHLGTNRIGMWNPVTGTTIATLGVPRLGNGTASTPNLSNTSLAGSCRRWRMTSAATAGSSCGDRTGTPVCWRGNAPGLGGFLWIARFSLTSLAPDSGAIFGIHNANAALSTVDIRTISIAFAGVGFKRGVDTNWQIVSNPNSGAVTVIDCGPAFPINDVNAVLSLYIFAPSNSLSMWIRLVNESTGAVFEQELSDAVLPQANVMMSYRHHLDNGATAQAVAYDCYGLYLETDY